MKIVRVVGSTEIEDWVLDLWKTDEGANARG